MARQLRILSTTAIIGLMLAIMLACSSEPTPAPTAIPEPTPEGPKPKPRWDVHLAGVESWSGSRGAGRRPLIARRISGLTT